jgi:tRNA pseudouridine55 synthase
LPYNISLTTVTDTLAINKPPSLSSAQVLRDLQHKFADSKTFAPLREETQSARYDNAQKRRRISSDNVFKMGHGGTLDPLATGVLIVGIGRGTKHLSDFLECKKTYETVVLFGKSTDTYDVAGKVVSEGPTTHITKESVEKQLAGFRGKIQQVPPIYSAIKINGMKLYDYARSGKELPREIESRTVEVSEATLLDFWEAGQHGFRYPAERLSDEEKATTMKFEERAEATKKGLAKQPRAEGQEPVQEQKQAVADINALPREEKAAMHTHHLPTQESSPAQAPAARIRITVSSGFYVRSLAHDLGIACGSYGTMAALARSRQAEFTTADPAPEGLLSTLTYKELDAGEDAWGPIVSRMLESWLEKHPAEKPGRKLDDRDRYQWKGRREYTGSKRPYNDREQRQRQGGQKRRNSSSPEA